MTRKSSRSSLINSVAVGCGIALALCFHFGQVTHTQAQQPTPSQAPVARPRKAHIRFWNLLPAGPTNDLQLFASNGESISGAAPNDVYTGYLPAPDGSYVLTVKRVGGKSAVIWRQPVVLPVNGFITLIASEKNGQPTAEMFNDTPDPNVVESTARIVVRQFCPGAHVKVSVAGGPSTQTLEYGDTSTLENIPLADTVNINLQAVLPTTPPSTKTWPLTADFSAARKATLIIVGDSYGRLRPQLSYDGRLASASSTTP